MKMRRYEEWGEDGENVKDGRGLVVAPLPGRQFGQGQGLCHKGGAQSGGCTRNHAPFDCISLVRSLRYPTKCLPSRSLRTEGASTPKNGEDCTLLAVKNAILGPPCAKSSQSFERN